MASQMDSSYNHRMEWFQLSRQVWGQNSQEKASCYVVMLETMHRPTKTVCLPAGVAGNRAHHPLIPHH